MKKIVFDCSTGQSEEIDDPNWMDLPDEPIDSVLLPINPMQDLENKIEDLQKQLQSMQEMLDQTIASQSAAPEQNTPLTNQSRSLQSTSGLAIPEPPWNT